jgi:transcriptional regulator with XRE-family HTH domain
MSDLFSERLRKLRGSRNKATFARFLGIPAPMYHRYELGQVPKNENLRVIAEHCGVTVDWLLGVGTDPPPGVNQEIRKSGRECYPEAAGAAAGAFREAGPCAGCAARDARIAELVEQVGLLIKTNAALADAANHKGRG